MDEASLTDFVQAVCNESHLRVETDLGGGFVRLRSEEAERRQAAHDIRATEDALIELLRNSRDAHAHMIFVATSKSDGKRKLVVIDDGDGVPETMRDLIFEPRVTSKLDTMHMDKWGVHGRGMALYAVRVNAAESCIVESKVGKGTALKAVFDTLRVSEKTDQSTFPTFEMTKSNSIAVRGPKNLLRACCEFAFEHRNQVSLYIGSASEIAATLYAYGNATLSILDRTFAQGSDDIVLTKRLALAADEETFCEIAESIGLEISTRTAYRIMKGEIKPVASLMELIQEALIAQMEAPSTASKKANANSSKRGKKPMHFAPEDLKSFEQKVKSDFADLSQAYYLNENVPISTQVRGNQLIIRIPLTAED